MITVDVSGIEGAIRRLNAITQDDALRRGMNAACRIIINALARYPRPPEGFQMDFVSEKQRRYFFWALRSGKITVPYRRTGTLGRLWGYRIDGYGLGMVGLIGNPIMRHYGKWVQDRESQARVHQGRWPTYQDVAREKTGDVKRAFENEIGRALRSGV